MVYAQEEHVAIAQNLRTSATMTVSVAQEPVTTAHALAFAGKLAKVAPMETATAVAAIVPVMVIYALAPNLERAARSIMIAATISGA
jgi:putative effector of murein hydrolase